MTEQIHARPHQRESEGAVHPGNPGEQQRREAEQVKADADALLDETDSLLEEQGLSAEEEAQGFQLLRAKRRGVMRKRDAAIGAELDAQALLPRDIRPGDIGVAHSKGIIGWLIRVGTRSHWNHSFVVVDAGDHTPETITVVQAEAHGVEYAKLADVAVGGSWVVLPCPLGVDTDLVVEQAHEFVGWDYAFVVIASLAVNIVLPFLRLQVQRSGTLICSAVSALSLHAGGYIHDEWPDLYAVTPAQVAVALSAPDA